MNINEQIEQMKKIQRKILEFLDKDDDQEEHFQNIIQQIEDQTISTNSHEMKTLLYLLSKILDNHYRYPGFFSKIEKIILKYRNEIAKNFTSYEIYEIFEKNPRFLLFLLNQKIIEMNEDIVYIMPERIFVYLFPKEALQKEMIKKVPENYEEKQKIGENDYLISQIIRKDLIGEFITYVNQNKYSLENGIEESIFETNDFLIENKETTLIEYAAFFGSIQIFKYLYMNGVELTPSLWIYGIHGNNLEIIHLLKENEIQPPFKSYEICIKESIKCHHNDITNYIRSNLINEDIQSINDINFEENYDDNIYSYCFQYFNFSYFPHEIEIENKIVFNYACKYDYFNIVEYLLNTTKIDIKDKIIHTLFFFYGISIIYLF